MCISITHHSGCCFSCQFSGIHILLKDILKNLLIRKTAEELGIQHRGGSFQSDQLDSITILKMLDEFLNTSLGLRNGMGVLDEYNNRSI